VTAKVLHNPMPLSLRSLLWYLL